MPRFEYSAVDPGGRTVSGVLEADNRLAALRQIEARELQPLTVENPDARAEVPADALRLTRRQAALFFEELADLLAAELQVDEALRVLEERQRNPAIRGAATAARTAIRDGASLSAALRGTSPAFDELACNLVAAGEVSGSLGAILQRLTANIRMVLDLESRVLQALLYPAFISLAGLGLVGVFMAILVPQLSGLFAKTGRQLPFATRILIETSGFLGRWGWLILLVLLLGASIFALAISKPAGRLRWDSARLRIPLIGGILRNRFLAQFGRTLATLIENGVPLLGALRLLSAATPNRHLRAGLDRAALAVADGSALSAALGREPDLVPGTFLDILAVGEQTGRAGPALEKAAERAEKELTAQIRMLTAAIQPTFIVLMALLVSLVAYSIMSGIFQSVSSLRGGA